MMRLFRLSFVSRMAILFIFSLVAIQVLVVMGFFIQRGSDTGTGFRLPLPDQVAATLELLEAAPPERHPTILRAINSAHIHARIEPVPPGPTAEFWRQTPAVERLLHRYLAALGERRVTVLLQRQERPLFLRLLPMLAPATLTIMVSMTGGQTLVIETGGPLLVNVFGFPPGFWAGVAGFVVALLAILIIRREVRPLRRLAEAADALDLSEPRPIADFPRSAPDIRAVISAFNRMQERIASLIRARMVMIGGFSHDVRTYATRLRLRAELIADETERARAIRDIEDMISLLDDALYAVQDRAPEQQQELVDLPALLAEEIEDRTRTGALVSLSVAQGAEEAFVLGSPVALRRLFANLVENAVTYGGEARMALSVAGGWISVDVEDSGPGISEELRRAVMQPFVRLEASRSRKTGGAGLGLAIARRIAEGHGGRMSIGAAVPRGAKLSVELPLFEANGGGAAVE